MVNQLLEDQGAFTNFLLESEKLVTTLASRRNELADLVTNTNQAAGAVASEASSLDQALGLLPGTLRKANSTFVNLRATLDDLDPLVAASKPATKDLARFLADLRPLVANAQPTFDDLALLVNKSGANNDLTDATQKFPQLASLAGPAFSNSITALKKAQPVIEFARPYAPDLVNWFRDFSQAAAPYDANGHYARVQPIFSNYTLGAGNVLNAIAAVRPLRRDPEGRRQAVPGRGQPGSRRRFRPVPGRRQTRAERLHPDADPSRSMKRVAMVAVVLVAAAWLAVAGTGAGSGESYEVRAIFSNAGFAIPGEDVRVAGVNVGAIKSVDLTAQNTAAIVLEITDDGFKDFREDATCAVRPQSLIGDRFVECAPTLPRPAGAKAPPELPVIEDGPGKGQHLVPVSQTTTPVDLDLINNIWRRPYRERLSIILSEFGTALAGQGTDLREAIRRSNPALAQTDEVLKHPRLAEQGAGQPGHRLRRRPRTARAGARARRRLHRAGQHRQPGHRRAGRRLRAQPRAAPALPAPAHADRAAPRRAGRRRHARLPEPAAGGSGDQQDDREPHAARRGRRPGAAVARELGRAGPVGPRGVQPRASPIWPT